MRFGEGREDRLFWEGDVMRRFTIDWLLVFRDDAPPAGYIQCRKDRSADLEGRAEGSHTDQDRAIPE